MKMYCVYGHGKETEASDIFVHVYVRLLIFASSVHIGELPVLVLSLPSHTCIRYTRGEYEYDEMNTDAADAMCHNSSECKTPRTPLDMPLFRPSWIDYEYTNDTVMPKVWWKFRIEYDFLLTPAKILNGVKMGEGDGTVSLLSLGAMCVDGWKRKRWNPAGIKVVTVEVSL